MAKLKDLTGKQFGFLTVVSFSHIGTHGRAVWNCVCACGKPTKKIGRLLLTGDTRSCGCYAKVISSGKLTRMNKARKMKKTMRDYFKPSSMVTEDEVESHNVESLVNGTGFSGDW